MAIGDIDFMIEVNIEVLVLLKVFSFLAEDEIDSATQMLLMG